MGHVRGWRVRVLIELPDGERWHVTPPEIDGDGRRHAGLSYSDACALARWHAHGGRRARVVDPEGRESDDVSAPRAELEAWRLTM